MSQIETGTKLVNAVCESLGLNPLTRPLEYIKLGGRLVLYAKKDATDQLTKLYRVSLKMTSREAMGDVFVVTVQAMTPDGRTDESVGASYNGSKPDLEDSCQTAQIRECVMTPVYPAFAKWFAKECGGDIEEGVSIFISTMMNEPSGGGEFLWEYLERTGDEVYRPETFRSAVSLILEEAKEFV